MLDYTLICLPISCLSSFSAGPSIQPREDYHFSSRIRALLAGAVNRRGRSEFEIPRNKRPGLGKLPCA
jgi:hypothetical protein